MGLGSAPGPVPSLQNKGLSRKRGEPRAPPKAATPSRPASSLFPSGISPSGSANTEKDTVGTHPGHPQHHSPSYSVFWTHQPTPRQQVSPLPEGLLPKPPPQLLLHPLASCWHTETRRNSGQQQQQRCMGTPARESLSPVSTRCAAAGLIIPEHTQSDTRPPFRSSGLGQRRYLGDSPSSAFVCYSVPVRLRFPFSLSIFYVLLLSPPLPREAGAPGRSCFAPTEAAP